MTFKFRRYEVHPTPADPSGVIYRPVVPIWIGAEAGIRVPFFGLLDTGADDTKFPVSVAETITTYDNDNKEVYSIKYKLDRDRTPNRISMTVTRSSRPEAVGMKALGLIKIQGDKLMMIYDFKGDEYPRDFDPKDNSQHYFEMKQTEEK